MNNFFLALKSKPFFFLWLSEIFSLTAFNMVNFLLILIAFSLTSSNTAVSGVVLSFTVPAIVFGILAGVYVDRWNKKYVLLITNAIRFFLAIILGLFHKNLPTLYLVSFLMAVVTQFFIPAETPIIPLLVEKKYLLSANALFSIAWFGAVLIAYALSGPFLLFFGTANALYFLSVLFLISTVCILFINSPKFSVKKNTSFHVNVTEEIKNTFHIILRNKDVSHAFFLLAFSQMLLLMTSVIGPGFAKNILGININAFPLLFVMPAVIGMALGAVIVTNYFHSMNRHKIATLGLFIAAAAIILMPYGSKVASRNFVHTINTYLPHFAGITILHIMIVLAFFLGIANSFMFVPSNTLVQENTTDELRGKIYGALNTVASLFSLLPVIAVGSLADIFGVGTVLTSMGVIIGIIGVCRLFI